MWELLTDNETVLGRTVTSAAALLVVVILAVTLSAVAARRSDDPATSYYARKAVRYVIGTVSVIGLVIYWQPFGGRFATVVGLATAGIAFAMQEVIGALAGFANILTGRIFRIGDRIQMGGVHGDVIDITPLRTRLMEIGSPVDSTSWVQGRQHTGRVVAVSNKTTFTQPVYNYSSLFDFIYEELMIPVSHHSDWRRAEAIMRQEAERASRSGAAQEALSEMRRRFPVPESELAPRVFVRATDNWMELVARFVVSTRTARGSKDELTRRIHDRLAAEGIEVASATMDVTIDRRDE